MSIESNIMQRQAAEELIDFADDYSFDDPAHFWSIIAEHAATHLPPPKVAADDEPMDAVEAARFGRADMPFGEFIGKPIGDVPLERLAWYADQDFVPELRRYLASKAVQDELRRDAE